MIINSDIYSKQSSKTPKLKRGKRIKQVQFQKSKPKPKPVEKVTRKEFVNNEYKYLNKTKLDKKQKNRERNLVLGFSMGIGVLFASTMLLALEGPKLKLPKLSQIELLRRRM